MILFILSVYCLVCYTVFWYTVIRGMTSGFLDFRIVLYFMWVLSPLLAPVWVVKHIRLGLRDKKQ